MPLTVFDVDSPGAAPVGYEGGITSTTHPPEDGSDVWTVQRMLGHTGVSARIIYTHVFNRGWGAVRSPADRLASSGPSGALEAPRARPPAMLQAGRHITAPAGRDGKSATPGMPSR